MKRAVAALLLIACGPPAPPKLTEVQTQVFTASCVFSSCHSALSQAGGLSLAPGTAYGSLVNVAATGPTGRTRVVPGDLSGSYLIDKLTLTAPAVGGRMPLGGDPVDAAQLKVVKDWISAGAKND